MNSDVRATTELADLALGDSRVRMRRLLVLSDLHLEFGDFDPPDSSIFDMVVLAGDIWNGVEGVEWAANPATFAGKPVVYVPGNHEFYRHERTNTLSMLRETANGTNVCLLDRDEVVIEGIRFLGATLWTDFKLDVEKGVSVERAMWDAKFHLNDFCGLIRQRLRNSASESAFTAQQSAKEHALSRAWLRKQLKVSIDDESIVSTVVVTHHAPSDRSMHPMFIQSRLNPSFYSALPPEFFQTANLWIHGHVHNSSDYLHHRTRIVANPRGYIRRNGSIENPDFKSDLIVEVPAKKAAGVHQL